MKSKEYNKHKLEDFITDDQFKRWVLDHPTDKRLDIFWHNWIKTHPQKRETILLAREILLAMEFNTPEIVHEEKEVVLEKVLKGEKSNLYTNNRYKYRSNGKTHALNWVIRVAAIFILGIGIYFLQTTLINDSDSTTAKIGLVTKKTLRGEKFAPLILPDGSRVYLNSESSITYPESFSDSIREVNMIGEGFFEVVKDEKKPFIVKTGRIITHVLGTSFNINFYENQNDLSISLVTGKVKVLKSQNNGLDTTYNSLVVLSPGEKVSIEKGTLDVKLSHFDTDLETAWKDGILIFKNSSHIELFNKLEKWYGVEVSFKNQPEVPWNVSGRFNNLSLEKALENLNYTHKISFDIEGKKVKINFLK
ncbi:MAG: FecR family protein [Cyclobacteriaceae bacterium]